MYSGSTTTLGGRVLILDHCSDTRTTVRDCLLAHGFMVVEAETAEDGLRALDEGGIDAVVMELQLTGADGFEVLRSIRAQSHVPVMVISSTADETDRVLAFELGADDMVAKPLPLRELVARLRALVRRASIGTSTPQIVRGSLYIDPVARSATLAGAMLNLTPRAFDLLAFLASRPGRVFTREELLRQVWQSEPEWQNAATVTEHIHRLRRAIEPNPDRPIHLITVRGNGYRFDP